jgi:hypothetical protein
MSPNLTLLINPVRNEGFIECSQINTKAAIECLAEMPRELPLKCNVHLMLVND